MNRGWLSVVLLLSLGVNLGLIGTAIAHRREPGRPEDGVRAIGGPTERPLDRRVDRIGELDAVEGERVSDEPSEELLGARLADRLELEGERRERFATSHRRMAAEIGDARREIWRVREEMRREIGAKDPDQTRLDGLLGELASAEVRLNRAFVDGILEARAGLDLDESRRLLRLMAELGPKRSTDDPRGLRPMPGGPPFGRRFGGDRRPPAPEAAPHSRP